MNLIRKSYLDCFKGKERKGKNESENMMTTKRMRRKVYLPQNNELTCGVVEPRRMTRTRNEMEEMLLLLVLCMELQRTMAHRCNHTHTCVHTKCIRDCIHTHTHTHRVLSCRRVCVHLWGKTVSVGRPRQSRLYGTTY